MPNDAVSPYQLPAHAFTGASAPSASASVGVRVPAPPVPAVPPLQQPRETVLPHRRMVSPHAAAVASAHGQAVARRPLTAPSVLDVHPLTGPVLHHDYLLAPG